MIRRALTLLVFAVLVGSGALGYAQSDAADYEPVRSESPSQSNESAAYARSLGDGLRHYAEGRFGQAVEHLFRAYAMDSRARTLELIIDAYDQMGFCDAAGRQLDLYERDHAAQTVPTLDSCASTGELSIECSQSEATVRIDGRFEARCGQTVHLPVGEHRLSGTLVESTQTVKIEQGKAARIDLTIRPRVSRLSQTRSTIGTGSEGSPRVDRLRGPAGDFTAYQSRDGLYHIFILPNSSGEAMFLPMSLRPEVLRLCDSGQRFDRDSRRCVEADGLQIKKME